ALKLALLAAGLVSGSVSAAFTEGDLAADNSITLNGEITNTNPVWAWKTGADQTDWDTTKLEWKVTGANATADFSGKGDVTLLDGYLVNLAPKGGVGLNPVVTIGGDGYTVTAGGGTMEQTAKVKVTGLTDATDATSTVDGEMTFKLVMALSTGWSNLIRGITLEGGVHNYVNPTTTANAKYMAALNKAWENQKLSVDYATAPYAGATTVAPSTTDFTPGQVFSNPGSGNITAGIHGNIHSAKVTFPAATIPESWEGALTVTVAYK
ncbi:F4 family fimbrial subunit, partial [Citrobacter sp. VF227]